MTGVTDADQAATPARDLLARHWWRPTFILATLVMAAFSAHDPLVALFAAVPVLGCCLGSPRAGRAGMVVGLVLLASAGWILLPRALGLYGPWVPSIFDVGVFLPALTAVTCAAGADPERAGRALRAAALSVFAVAGLLLALVTAVSYSEGTTGDEGVWPGPPGLEVVAGDQACGSGGCTRVFDATGDRAPERARAYLESRGFTTPGPGDGWVCRVTGIVFTYEVCATVEEVSPTTARVRWSL